MNFYHFCNLIPQVTPSLSNFRIQTHYLLNLWYTYLPIRPSPSVHSYFYLAFSSSMVTILDSVWQTYWYDPKLGHIRFSCSLLCSMSSYLGASRFPKWSFLNSIHHFYKISSKKSAFKGTDIVMETDRSDQSHKLLIFFQSLLSILGTMGLWLSHQI